MANRIPLDSVEHVKNKRVFFDANIWIFLEGPMMYPSNRKTEIYSRAYKKILQNENYIVTDHTVISEFINRFARIEHDYFKQSGEAHENFKSFRKSTNFLEIAERISDTVHSMTQGIEILSFTTPKERFYDIIDDYKTAKHDYNDLVIIEICQQNNLLLLTDDADFYDAPIDIITGNNKLLGP